METKTHGVVLPSEAAVNFDVVFVNCFLNKTQKIPNFLRGTSLKTLLTWQTFILFLTITEFEKLCPQNHSFTSHTSEIFCANFRLCRTLFPGGHELSFRQELPTKAKVSATRPQRARRRLNRTWKQAFSPNNKHLNNFWCCSFYS